MSAGDRKHPARLTPAQVADRRELLEVVGYALGIGVILTLIVGLYFGALPR